MRLILSRPRPDETISSIIDRACSLYRISRFVLIDQLCPSFRSVAGFHDFDVHPPAELVKNLAAALNMREEEVEALKLKSSIWRLPFIERAVICPKCVEEDVASKRDPYFRAEWTWFFLTHCPAHGCPLEDWPGIYGCANERVWPRMMMASGDIFSSDQVDADQILAFSAINRFALADKDVYKLWSDIIRFERWLLANESILYTPGSTYGKRLRYLHVLLIAKWAVRQPRKWAATSLGDRLVPEGRAKLLFDQSSYCISGRFKEIWENCLGRSCPELRRRWTFMLSQLINVVPGAGLLSLPRVDGFNRRHWMKVLVWQCLSECGREVFSELIPNVSKIVTVQIDKQTLENVRLAYHIHYE